MTMTIYTPEHRHTQFLLSICRQIEATALREISTH